MNRSSLFFVILVAITLATANSASAPMNMNWTVWQGYMNFSKLQLCEVPAANGIQCQVCKGNLTNIFSGYCQLLFPVDNCYAFDMCWNCQLCHDGYYVNYSTTYLNTCVSKKVGCLVFDDINKVCLQCMPGFTMNTSSNVYAKLDSQSFCYFVPDPNCASYSLMQSTTCTSCMQGYQLIVNRCYLIPTNCYSLSQDKSCSKCITDYQLDSNKNCIPIPKILNCQYQVDYTCQRCLTGFTLQNNICKFMIDNCNIVSGQICQQCNTGYVVNSLGKCSLIPKIPNCLNQIDITCQKCIDGYSLSNNQCVFSIPNCLEVSGQVCTKCSADFLLFNGLCILKISNCSTQSALTCTKCIDGYDLVNNVCIYHIDNCIKVSGKICTQCSQSYTLTADGLCKPNLPTYDPNCRKFDNILFSRCLECSNGFFLNSKQICQQVDPLCKTYSIGNGFCLSCYVGYDVVLSTGKCVKSIVSNSNTDNCNQYDFTKNVCVKCSEGSYFDEFGKCRKFYDANCKVPSSDLKSCAQCYIGYSLDTTQNKCTLSNFNCASWKDGKCATCPQGFYMNENKVCIQIDTLCALFNPAIKRCLLCYPGYGLDQNKVCKDINNLPLSLRKYQLNCVKFNTNNQCMACYSGWYLTQDSTATYCEKVSQYCKTSSSSTGKCTSCYLGYYLTGQGQCLRFY